MSLSPRRIIVFDFDNVLALTMPIIGEAMEQFLSEMLTISLTEAQRLRHEFFQKTGSTLTSVAHAYGFDRDWVEEAYAEIGHRSTKRYLELMQPCPHMPKLLQQALNQGYELAVLTNNHQNAVLPIMAAHGLAEAISHENVFDRTRTEGGNKRTATPYRILLQSLNLSNHDEKWMVEDTPANLIQAKQNGFRTVLVGTEQPTSTEQLGYIDYCYTQPNAVAFMQDLLAGKLNQQSA